jgi:hypothetical protein
VLSLAQVEEIYAKMEVPERHALATWALAARGNSLAFSAGTDLPHPQRGGAHRRTMARACPETLDPPTDGARCGEAARQ